MRAGVLSVLTRRRWAVVRDWVKDVTAYGRSCLMKYSAAIRLSSGRLGSSAPPTGVKAWPMFLTNPNAPRVEVVVGGVGRRCRMAHFTSSPLLRQIREVHFIELDAAARQIMAAPDGVIVQVDIAIEGRRARRDEVNVADVHRKPR